ncbi:MAG TPA: hypothetical protein VD966_03130, partial [Pyrinomonadaceae bacterium]|nr:hypothetical protein [Pyrinomonadaceae bacterium]
TGDQATASASGAQATLASLPASDAVIFVDVRRLLNDALPRVFAGDPAKLAKVNAEVDQFKTRYGIDPRSFDRVAVGARFNNPSANVITTDLVAVAHGTFNAGAIVAAGRLASKGKYREEKYAGKTIYIFSVNDQVKMLGLLNMRVRDLAVSALDANTLAVGELATVRAAIDARSGRGRVSPELVSLATRTPDAIVGFGANMPPNVTQNINLDNEEISKNIASIRQVYGAVGTTTNGFDALAVALTERPEQAQSLSDTLAALKQFGSVLAAQLPGDKGKLAQNALENLRVTTQGNELQIRLELAQTDLAMLVRGL